jgi:hypothetical protein
MSRRRVAHSWQRQIDRYRDAHPDLSSETDLRTVFQFQAKRDENNAVGDSARTSMVASFVPATEADLVKELSAVGQVHSTNAAQHGAVAAKQAYALAKEKFLKNTTDVTNRRVFNQARDFREAKNLQRKGSEAERLNAVLPLIGAAKANPYLAQYGVLSQQKGVLGEKNIAERQLRIAEQNMDENPSEDNAWKLRLARATFDWRDQYEKFYRSRSFNTLAKAALPKLASSIFSASQTLRYKDVIDAQKRIARITLQMRQRDYAKKYATEGDETQQRFLALSSYGAPAKRDI